MGDEAYKAWGLRATIVAMRPLTHPSPSLHRIHYGLLHVENSRAEISRNRGVSNFGPLWTPPRSACRPSIQT